MSATIKLSHPITFDGKEISSLTMRRSKVSDRRIAARVEGTDADQEVRLFANLCEVTDAAIDELDERDYANLAAAYLGFRKPTA